MAGFNGLEIHHIHEILKGGGLAYRSDYTSEKQSKEKKYTTKIINRCIELGWSKNFLKEKFHTLNDSMLEQWPTDLFIKDYMNHFIQETETDNSIFNNLKKIGLRIKVAKHLTNLFSPLDNTCYTDKQLINKALLHLLGYDAPLTTETTTHHFYPRRLGKWFSVKDYSPKIMNIPLKCTNEEALSYIENTAISSVLPTADSELYFHSTSWSSCISILQDIIKPVGRTCLDFGQDSGFYMSPSLKDSLEWTIKNNRRYSNEGGIIIFNLPKKFPDELKFKHLKDSEWTSVTKKSRQCKSKYYQKIPEIYKYRLLYGDIVANPKEVEMGGEPEIHNPPKKQLVSKHDIASEFIHERIVGCLFFQKHFIEK